MKTYADRLRETPIPVLEDMILKQMNEIKIAQRDLETMQRILEERKSLGREA